MFPAYNAAAQGEKTSYGFEYRDMDMGYYTGLEVSHEPGQWLVWSGVLLMGGDFLSRSIWFTCAYGSLR